MGSSAGMKMVNGRVDGRVVAKAAKVLEREGLTISSFIRNSLEHVARAGEVPPSGREAPSRHAGKAELRSLVKSIEAKPMPGKPPYASLGEDALVERLRMERHGY